MQLNNDLAKEKEKVYNKQKNIATKLGVNQSFKCRKRVVHDCLRPKSSETHVTITDREEINSLNNSKHENSSDFVKFTTKERAPENLTDVICPEDITITEMTKNSTNLTKREALTNTENVYLGGIPVDVIAEILEIRVDELISLFQKNVSFDEYKLAKKECIEALIREMISIIKILASLTNTSSTKR